MSRSRRPIRDRNGEPLRVGDTVRIHLRDGNGNRIESNEGYPARGTITHLAPGNHVDEIEVRAPKETTRDGYPVNWAPNGLYDVDVRYVSLTSRKARPHPLGPIMFADTTTSRMLRLLLERSLASFAPDRAITQAAFMREYHLRCERAMPSRSSFTCNFGRFLVGGTVERPLAVIGQELIMTTSRSSPRSVGDRKSRHGSGVVPTKRNNLMWVGPSLAEILAGMSALQLRTAIASMESQLAGPRLTDKPDETERWLGYLRDEVIAHDASEAGDNKHATEIRNQITQRGKDVYAK